MRDRCRLIRLSAGCHPLSGWGEDHCEERAESVIIASPQAWYPPFQTRMEGPAMRARIIIEYDTPNGDRIAMRDREEQRWMRSETLLALRSATVKFEWVDEAKAS